MSRTFQTVASALAVLAASAAFAPAQATIVFLNPTKRDGLATMPPVPTVERSPHTHRAACRS